MSGRTMSADDRQGRKTKQPQRLALGNAGLGRRLVSGFGAQAITMIVVIGERILLVPLYLYAWGVARYEDWLLIGAAAGFTRLLDFGMEFHFGNALRLSLAAGDRPRFDRSLAIGITCYAVVMVGITIAISLFVLLAPAELIFDLSAMTSAEAMAIVWLFVVHRTLLLPRPFIRSIYAAHGEFSRGENMFTLFTLGMAITISVMLILRAPPIVVAIASIPAGILVCWVPLITDQKRRYSNLHFIPAIPTRRELRGIVKNARYYMLPISAEMLIVQGPVLLIGLFARQTGEILMFSLSRTLTGLARQGAVQLSRSGGIELARQLVQGDRAGALRLHRTLGRTMGGLTGLTCGFIWITAEPVIAIWTGGKVPFDSPVVTAFVLGVLFVGPAQANYTLLQFSNVPIPLAVSSLLQVSLVGGLGILLIPHFGGLGAAVAVGVADAMAYAVLINEAAARRFRLFAEKFAAIAYGSEIAGLAIGSGAGWLLARFFVPDTIVSLVVYFGLWGSLVMVPAVFLVLSRQQRSRVFEHIRKYREMAKHGVH